MREMVVVLIAACSGTTATPDAAATADATVVDAIPFAVPQASVPCVEDGLAGLPFDGVWHLEGVKMQTLPPPPATTTVDTTMAIHRWGTGHGKASVDLTFGFYADDTVIALVDPTTGGVRDPGAQIVICKRASDGAILYEETRELWAMQKQFFWFVTGVLTR